MRALAVDHGEKRIGLAVSDATGTLARPLTILKHVSRALDAQQVSQIAAREQASLIVIGQSFDEAGRPNLAGRRAARFAEALKVQTNLEIVMWDESLSTRDARAARLALGVARQRRRAAVDALAAAMLLQSFLDSDQSPARK